MFLENACSGLQSPSNDPEEKSFTWGLEQQQAFEQIEKKIVHAVPLGLVQGGQNVKYVLYTAARENVPIWSFRGDLSFLGCT